MKKNSISRYSSHSLFWIGRGVDFENYHQEKYCVLSQNFAIAMLFVQSTYKTVLQWNLLQKQALNWVCQCRKYCINKGIHGLEFSKRLIWGGNLSSSAWKFRHFQWHRLHSLTETNSFKMHSTARFLHHDIYILKNPYFGMELEFDTSLHNLIRKKKF